MLEVLELADGTKINPLDGSIIEDKKVSTYTEIPNYADTQRQIVAARRRIADLPLPPKEMTSIGIILFYSTIGLDDNEISSITGLTTDQIGRIRVNDTYVNIQNEFIDRIVENDIDEVRGLFINSSRKAAKKVENLMDSAKTDSIKLSAAKDILDRAGHRPADIVEHRLKMEGGLTIKVIKVDETDKLPIVDGTVEVVDEAVEEEPK